MKLSVLSVGLLVIGGATDPAAPPATGSGSIDGTGFGDTIVAGNGGIDTSGCARSRSDRPTFHDGSAATLDDVVTFYDDTFDMHLSPQDRADLVAFLGAL